MCPGGYAFITRTFSPTLYLASPTLLHLDHLARELRGRSPSALDHAEGHGAEHALVVPQAIVGLRRKRLDVLPPFIDRHQLPAAGDAGEQYHERIDPALPRLVVMFRPLHLARRPSAQVVVASLGKRPSQLLSQLVRSDDAPLDQALRERPDPALVVAHALVGLGGQRLDVLAVLIDRHAPRAAPDAPEEHAHRVDPALPVIIVVLGALELSGRLAAHVVVAVGDFHATHSDTGALASCKGWQTMSTSVGPS